MYCVHTEEANLRLARARPLFLREITVATQDYSPRHCDIYLRDKTPDE